MTTQREDQARLQTLVDTPAYQSTRWWTGYPDDYYAEKTDTFEPGDDNVDFNFQDHIYDVEFQIFVDGRFKGVKLWTAVGGPSIYLDTMRRAIVGDWMGCHAERTVASNVIHAIEEYWEEALPVYTC